MAPSTATSNLTESFVTVGTPLPSLEKADKGEFKPIWEQEAVDEKGRRRFHGAFTGGFSAGYHGTVGSKEGWAPSTFKSSRSDRAGAKSTAQMAEAFMDEEDLADVAASRTLSTAAAYSAPPPSSYDPLLGVFGAQQSSNSSNLPAIDALASLIEPATTRIGAQLMRKMGWRDGQGVGPRVTLQQRKKQAKELGIKLEDEDDDEGEASKHYYAPLDRPLGTVLEIGSSTDRGWGLGYKPGPGIQSSSSTAQTTQGAARMTLDDDDEDDVYGASAGPSGNSSRGIVDLDDMDDGITLMDGRSAAGPTKNFPKASSSSTPRKPLQAKQSFHDNTPLVNGFTLVHDTLPGTSMSALPPKPPPKWSPNPKRLWEENAAPSSDAKGKGKQLDANERGVLLGEKAPEPVAKSVFDYLSEKDKARLASLAPGSSSSSSSSAPVEPDEPLFIPPLDKPTALAALKGFQPFSATSTSPDPTRQARYTLYLQLQAEILPPSDATLPFGPRKFPTGKVQTIGELNRELDDYARAARVFKPVSGMLAGRFTSGGAGGPAPKAEPGLFQPSKKGVNFITSGEEPEAPEPEKLTPAQVAARAGMFGTQTRTVESFRPTKLLCKRFGVPDPWAGEGEDLDGVGGAWKEATRTGFGRPADSTGVGEVLGKSSMDQLMQSAGFRKIEEEEAEEQVPMMAGDVGTSLKGEGSKKVELPTLETVGLGDDEKQGAETLTYTKAPKDIFDAIFADSDDEDSDEDEEESTEAVASGKMVAAPAGPAHPPPTQLSGSDTPASNAFESVTPAEEIILTTDNLSSYKPSFTGGNKSSTKSGETEESGKKKKKKKSKVSLSFDVDDGDDGEREPGSEASKKSTKKRKRDREEKKPDSKISLPEDEEDGMEWVEKPQLSPAPVPAVRAATQEVASEVVQVRAGRAKAADLY
ncbi:hypothetical protein T439DRAFT_323868 [Meredithblackwellia eburnea MCA 4105]